jgi:hypothetical protein
VVESSENLLVAIAILFECLLEIFQFCMGTIPLTIHFVNMYLTGKLQYACTLAHTTLQRHLDDHSKKCAVWAAFSTEGEGKLIDILL